MSQFRYTVVVNSPAPTVDVSRLVKVLEQRIDSTGGSWRQAAAKIGVSPSLLSRLKNGQQPDLPAFAKITAWLGMTMDEFLGEPTKTETETELQTAITALLRGRHDLDDADKQYLESVFTVTIRHIREVRPKDRP